MALTEKVFVKITMLVLIRFSVLRKLLTALVLACLFFTWVPIVYGAAGINKKLSYQAKITASNGINIANSSYNMQFAFFTVSTGGSAAYTETWNSGTSQVSLTDGIFSVDIGTHTSLPGSLDFNTDNLYLEVRLDADNNGSYEEVFLPRKRMTASPYAFNTDALDGKSEEEFADTSENETITGSYTFQANTSVTVNTSSGSAIVINQQGTGGILDVQDNGTSALRVLDGGLIRTGSAGTANNADGLGDLYIQNDLEVDGTSYMTGITNTGAVTSSGAAISLNASSNFATNINTGTSTGAVSIGGNSNTLAINTSSWDVSSAGVASGLTGLTVTGATTTSGGIASLNASSNFATNINTGTSTGAVSIGGNSNTLAINTSSWDVSSAGVASGLTGLTVTGTTTASGAVISLNANSNFATNINTGTSTGTVTIGNASANVAITDGQWSVSGAGAASFVGVNSTTGLIQGTGGLTVSGASSSINENSNFATNINTGTSTGAVSIGNSSNALTLGGIIQGASPLVFEGATDDTYETTFSITDTTASDKTITFQDNTGVVPLGTAGNTLFFTTSGATSITLPTSGTMATGTGTNGYVAYWNGTNSLTSEQYLSVGRGGTGTGTEFTSGSLVFAGGSGVYSQDNTNLFWDDTNNRLGIGTASPQQRLHVSGSAAGSYIAGRIENTGLNGAADFDFINDARQWKMGVNANDDFRIQDTTGGSINVFVIEDGASVNSLYVNSSGNVGVGTSAPSTFKLQVAGSVGPNSDDSYDLGSSSLRWRDLYLGPSSLHVYSTAAETTTARDWKIGIQETDGSSEGNLRILEGTNEFLNITPAGNIGIGDTTPASLFTVGNGDLFQVNSSGAIASVQGITNTGAVTSSGGAVSLNASSNFATNINTGTSTGAVSIGGGSNTLAINTSSWDVSSAGVASGLTGLASSGNILFNSLGTESGVYTDSSGYLTTTPPSTGTLGYWTRSGTNLSPSITDDTISISSSDVTNPVLSLTSLDLQTDASSSISHNVTMNPSDIATLYGYKLNISNNPQNEDYVDTVYGMHINIDDDFGGYRNTITGLYVDTDTANSRDNTYSAVFNGGNVGVGDSSPDSLFTVGNGDLFQVNSSGAIVSVRGITNTGSFVTSGNTVYINHGSNFATNINTGTSTGTVTIGNASANVVITDGQWSVSGAGAASFVGVNSTTGVIQGTGGLTVSGATSSINASSNFTTNINTGTSTGAVSIGNASNALTLGGVIQGASPLVFEGATDNTYETTFAITDPTVSDKTITFQDNTGVVPLGTAGNTLFFTTSGATSITLPTSGTVATGTGTNGYIAYWNGTNSLTSEQYLNVTRGGTGTGTQFTSGSLVFAGGSGVYTQDNSNLFWDDTNNRLGVGTSTPASTLSVLSQNDASDIMEALRIERINYDSSGAQGLGASIGFYLENDQDGLSQAAGIDVVWEDPRETREKASVIFNHMNNSSMSEAFRISYEGYIGIGDSSPTSLFTVGNGDLFQVNSYGNLVKVNNVSYSWPASQGASNTYLRNDGSGNLTWVTVSGTGDITTVGSMTSGDVFMDANADDDWLGLGAAAGRITFDDQATDYVNILSANVGIGETTPASLLTVGSGDTFQVNSSGNLVKVNNVTYSWPSAQGGAGTVLSNNGSGTLTWVTGSGTGDITTVGSMTGGDVFMDANADDDWLGLGASAGRVAFDDQATDYVNIMSANLGVGDATPASLFTVGDGDLFQVNSSGNIVKVNNVTYSWPGSQGSSNTVLRNDGSGNLTWVSAGTGDVTSVGSMTSGDAFSDANADDDWLGLGSIAGRIAFDDQATDYVNILSANVGIGDATPASLLTVGNGDLFQVNSSGYALYPLGAVGTPSVSFVSDPNTGIYSSGADALDFATGGTNRMTINSSGNISVGTTATSYSKFTISSNQANSSVYNWLTFDNQGGGYGDWTIHKQNTNDLAFSSGTTNGQTLSNTVMTLLYGGNVGVGDITPDQLLEIMSSGAANTQFTISNTNAGNYDSQIGFELADGTNTFTMGIDDSDSDKFKISTTALGTNDRFVIDSSGNIGIGTNTPSSILHLSKANTTATVIDTLTMNVTRPSMDNTGLGSGIVTYLEDNDGMGLEAGSIDTVWESAGVNSGVSSMRFNVRNTGSMIEAMRVDNAGYVGIGDSSPASLFTVGSGDLFQVNSSGYAYHPLGAVGNPSISFVGDTNTGVYSSGADTIDLTTAGTRRLSVTSGGLVGVGAFSNPLYPPSSLLDIEQTGTDGGLTDFIEITNTRQASSNTQTGVLFNQWFSGSVDDPGVDGSARIIVGTEGAWNDTASTRDSYFSLQTSLNGDLYERMRINSNGYMGIGDTSPDAMLDVASSSAINTNVFVVNTNAGDYDTAIGFQLAEGTNSFTMGVDDSDSDKFKISTTGLGTSDRFVIDSSGNIGLGFATPSTNLHLYENSTQTTPMLMLQQAGTGDPAIGFVSDTSSSSGHYVMGIDSSTSYDDFVIGFNDGSYPPTFDNSYGFFRVMPSDGSVNLSGIYDDSLEMKLGYFEDSYIRYTGYNGTSIRFGLGTNAPSANFHIYENSTETTPMLKIEQMGTGDATLMFKSGDDTVSMGIDTSAPNISKFKMSMSGDGGAWTGTALTVSYSGRELILGDPDDSNITIGSSIDMNRSLFLTSEDPQIAFSDTNVLVYSNSGPNDFNIETNSVNRFSITSDGDAYFYGGRLEADNDFFVNGDSFLGYTEIEGSFYASSTVAFDGLPSSGTAGTAIHINGSNQLFKYTSSRRYKKSITDIETDTSKIFDLRPVSYTPNELPDLPENRTFGLIAEEAAEVLPQLVFFDNQGRPDSVHYEILSVLLLKEMQKTKTNILDPLMNGTLALSLPKISSDGGVIQSDGLGNITTGTIKTNSFSSDNGLITSNGLGTLSVNNLAVTSGISGGTLTIGSFSSDGGLISTNGAGTLTAKNIVVTDTVNVGNGLADSHTESPIALADDTNTKLDGTFTSTSIVGALNELNRQVFDLAKYYQVGDLSIEQGDLVSIDPSDSESVVKATRTSGKSVIGVVTEHPNTTLETTSDDQSSKLVVLVGRVPVKIDINHSADIVTGDYLSSSPDMPGYAIKATGPGFVVGQAMSGWSSGIEPSTNSVIVFVQPQYWIGMATTDELYGLSLVFDDEEVVEGDDDVQVQPSAGDIQGVYIDPSDVQQTPDPNVQNIVEDINPQYNKWSLGDGLQIDVAIMSLTGALVVKEKAVFEKDLVVKGNVEIQGTLVVRDAVTLEKNLELKGGLSVVSKDVAGSVRFSYNQITQHIAFVAPKKNEVLVSLTPKFEDPDTARSWKGRVWVSNQTEEGFDIEMSEPVCDVATEPGCAKFVDVTWLAFEVGTDQINRDTINPNVPIYINNPTPPTDSLAEIIETSEPIPETPASPVIVDQPVSTPVTTTSSGETTPTSETGTDVSMVENQ